MCNQITRESMELIYYSRKYRCSLCFRRPQIAGCVQKALVYYLGISGDTRRNAERIFDFDKGTVKPE